MWEIEVQHEGLGKYRHIRGSDRSVVEQKARYQKMQWNDQWQRKLDADRRVQDREEAANQKCTERQRLIDENIKQKEQSAFEKNRQKEEAQRYKDDRKREGIDRDSEAKSAIETLKNSLVHTLAINDAISWDQLKDKSSFSELSPKLEFPPSPVKIPIPTAPVPSVVPLKPGLAARPNPPLKDSAKYQPVFGFFDQFLSSRKLRKIEEAEALFKQDYTSWTAECAKLDDQDAANLRSWEGLKQNTESRNATLSSDWERSVERVKAENISKKSLWDKNCEQIRLRHEEAVKEWEQRKVTFYERQVEINAAIDSNHENYMSQDQGAIADYCDSVLSNSIYPDYFPNEWDLDYNADTRTLVVDYALPAPESLPTLKEVQYIQSKDDFKESYLSEKEHEALYDGLLYQIALRTIHELFEADTAAALDAVAFNGIVTALDKTTGHSVTACVLSLLARKEPFLQINLANIDPKACFKSLKGVAATKLTGITPISPILIIDKNDRRFVSAYSVAESLDEGTNLATMDWEDFEHLIREVFEQEFATSGGEVKVTQASRDGGVDAIAFDPDPIRGGKIVIQAKRYTNVVGVAAVRDLYGTVINEGATKGILVTTANYGPDAYEFAKGKPLSLLSGANLLHLLEKHGHQARININEAKQFFKSFV